VSVAEVARNLKFEVRKLRWVRKLPCKQRSSLIRAISPSTSMSDPSYNAYYNQYQQQSSAYDVNPYYVAQPNYAAYNANAAASSSSTAPRPANAYEYDVGAAAQQSVYVPGALLGKQGGSGGKVPKGGKRTTVIRKGGGKVWEDQTLLEWDPSEFFPRESDH
jgi:hypothetical protein